MIRTEAEYKEAVRELKKSKDVIAHQRAELAKHKLPKEALQRALAPLLSFHNQKAEEIQWYENVRRQDFGQIRSLRDVGRVLIALRIASGLTQRDLANLLDVGEAQVSRDERNEYHGVTLERAQRILDIFNGAHLSATVKTDKPLRREDILAFAAK